MDLLSYPSQIPPPQTNGYGYKTSDNLHKTKIERGTAHQRKRPGKTTKLVTLNWQLSDSELALQEGFERHALGDGAGWFEMQLKTGNEFVSHQVRYLVSDKKVSLVAPNVWAVSVEAEAKVIT